MSEAIKYLNSMSNMFLPEVSNKFFPVLKKLKSLRKNLYEYNISK